MIYKHISKYRLRREIYFLPSRLISTTIRSYELRCYTEVSDEKTQFPSNNMVMFSLLVHKTR